MSKPMSVLCIYRIKPGKEGEFLEILRRHWPTLDRAGLVSETPARIFSGSTKDGKQSFIEIFEWKDEETPNIAHQTPEVMAIWEPMGALTEGMEFIHLEPVTA
ncbi:MAG: hypothetical protein DMF61_16030 [Blastocatellia bacterium AA13]|nr:MAG: hypothetical protein DMF61_16030 [Blastocatellia bacterium AA13]